MFKNAVRAARPAVLAARTSLKPLTLSVRTFSTTLRTQSGGPPAPQLFGPGGKPGAVPTDLEQATGLERLQLLGELEGINVFDDSPLDSSRLGTKADPVMVQCLVRDTTIIPSQCAFMLTVILNRTPSVLWGARVSPPTPMISCGSTWRRTNRPVARNVARVRLFFRFLSADLTCIIF